MTAGELWQSGLDVYQVIDKASTDLVKRILQKCYFELAKKADWVSLRRRLAFTFTGLETDGQYLPSDLVNVLAVVCETSGAETIYWPTEETYR